MGQTGVTNAEPEHNVTLTKGFYLGKYEVMQAQYETIMEGSILMLRRVTGQTTKPPGGKGFMG